MLQHAGNMFNGLAGFTKGANVLPYLTSGRFMNQFHEYAVGVAPPLRMKGNRNPIPNMSCHPGGDDCILGGSHT